MHQELWNWLKFDHTDNWYMHKPKYDQENETHKIIKQSQQRRLDFMLINFKKRICPIVGFAVAVDHGVKRKENEKVDKNADLDSDLKKLKNLKATVVLIVVWAIGIILKGLERRMKKLDIRAKMETNNVEVI